MKCRIHSIRLKAAAAILGLVYLGVQATISRAATLPPSTTIPVYFTHTIKAGKAKPGDPVTAITDAGRESTRWADASERGYPYWPCG